MAATHRPAPGGCTKRPSATASAPLWGLTEYGRAEAADWRGRRPRSRLDGLPGPLGWQRRAPHSVAVITAQDAHSRHRRAEQWAGTGTGLWSPPRRLPGDLPWRRQQAEANGATGADSWASILVDDCWGRSPLRAAAHRPAQGHHRGRSHPSSGSAWGYPYRLAERASWCWAWSGPLSSAVGVMAMVVTARETLTGPL